MRRLQKPFCRFDQSANCPALSVSYAAAAGAHGFRFSPWLRACARYVCFSRTAIRFTQKLLSGQRGILFQIEIWKSQESFTYFKIFKPISWGKRPAERRSRLIQRFLILESVKKLEELFIAPTARQILHETAQRAFARCECA